MNKILTSLLLVGLCELVAAKKNTSTTTETSEGTTVTTTITTTITTTVTTTTTDPTGHCHLQAATSFLRKFTKKVSNWFNALVGKVEKSEKCKKCKSIRAADTKYVIAKEDRKFRCHCGIKAPPTHINTSNTTTNNTSNSVYECGCCYKVDKWDVLICVAAGFITHNTSLFIIVTVDNFAIFHFYYEINLKILKYFLVMLSCVPLPAPLTWLAGCLTPTLESPSPATNNSWRFCASIQVALFQIPVLTLYTKCFYFGKSEASIEGQSNTLTEVNDDSNYNSVICLTNSEKEAATRGGGARQDDTVVVETGRTSWKESNPTDLPPYLVVLHQQSAVPVDDLLDPSSPVISDMLKRAQQEKWLKKESALHQPTESCGGVLLTKRRVLTICACVRSFYVVNKLAEVPRPDFFPFDIMSYNIYMEIPGVVLKETEKYRLSKDPDKFMTEGFCVNRLKTQDPWGLRALMIAMAFEPEITDPKPGQFVNWPPRMVNKGEEVVYVAFDMETRNVSAGFRDSSGRLIDITKRAVTFQLKQCRLTNYGASEMLQEKSGTLPFTFNKRLTGFCSRTRNSEVCQGKIGYPVVAEGEFMSLSALPLDCDDEGSIAGTVFDAETVKEIDAYIKRTGGGGVSNKKSSTRHVVSLASIIVAVFIVN